MPSVNTLQGSNFKALISTWETQPRDPVALTTYHLLLLPRSNLLMGPSLIQGSNTQLRLYFPTARN